MNAQSENPTEMFGLQGQVAIVTGGAGIGRGIAELFAAAGAAVVVSDRNQETAAAVAQDICDAGGRALTLACDVTDEAAIKEVHANNLHLKFLPPITCTILELRVLRGATCCHYVTCNRGCHRKERYDHREEGKNCK